MCMSQWKHKLVFSIGMFCTTVVQANSHHPQAFLDSIQGTSKEGQAIVKHFCASCHAPHPLISIGAPRIGHPEDWQERLKQGPKILWQHTNEGFHAMPARGGCFECSDEQLKKAILILTGP